jgi:hypothetical protein
MSYEETAQASYDEAQARRRRPGPDHAGVGVKLDAATSHARGIEEAIDTLGERLSPLLRQPGPSLADGRIGEVESAGSALGDVVERHADHLHALVRRLHELVDRIDL